MTPLPPAPTGVAHHSLRLAEALVATGEVELDLFAEERDDTPAPTGPAGVDVFGAGSLPAVESARGRYDRLLLAFGNSDNHIAALGVLRHRSAVVIAHDVRLTNLYYFAALRDPTVVPEGFSGALARLYGDELPPGLGAGARLDPFEEDRYGILMAGEVVERAERYLVSSRSARALARLDVAPDTAAKIGLLPFAADVPVPGRSGFDDPSRGGEAPPPGAPPLVVAFGILAPIRQPLRLLEAFASAQTLVPQARLAFVGPAPPELAQLVLAHADRLGVGRQVAVTGEVRTSRYLEWMRSATVAAQLRGEWNGEASGSVAEALVAGLPVMASNIGWVRELPDGCVMKIDPRMTTQELGASIAHLLRDEQSRAALREGARAFAPKLSFANAAQTLLDELFHGRRAPGVVSARASSSSIMRSSTEDHV